MDTAVTAHDNYTSICTLRRAINTSFWSLVSELKACREHKWWEALGHTSWGAYLAQPEIDLHEHTVDNWITTYNRISDRKLLPHAGVVDLAISKLSIIAPHLTDDNAEELLEKARTLSRRDLVAEITGKEPIFHEKHECPLCGSVHDIAGESRRLVRGTDNSEVYKPV